MTFSLSGDICETLGLFLCSTVPLIKVFPWILFTSINFVQMTWGSVTKVYDLDIWCIFANQFALRGLVFLSQFTNHWYCRILIIVVLSGEISRGSVLPYMGYIGMCRCKGYGFQAAYSRIGYINQSVWVQNRVSFFWNWSVGWRFYLD